jgi:DNA-binding transcriptional regulator/RsmH inhibitor MraZ
MDYFERKLDDKNRLTIPRELQSELGNEVVVTQGFGQYLHLYSKEVWDNEMEIALSGDILDESIADLNVKFRIGKSTSKLDSKQGRVTLEAHQMALLTNARTVAMVRAGKYWRIVAK